LNIRTSIFPCSKSPKTLVRIVGRDSNCLKLCNTYRFLNHYIYQESGTQNLKNITMTKKLLLKNILFGFLTWLIPLVISFLFYKRSRELTIPYDLFKSVMIVVSSISGCYFLFRYFNLLNSDYVKNGLIIGLSWLFINIILDVFVLIPIMKMNFSNYFLAIGLRYFVIPAMSITIGYLLSNKTLQLK
jgi:hypothetical protein